VQRHQRRPGAITQDLHKLAEWLRQFGVTKVAMESSGVYWKPLCKILDTQFTLVLANAQHIKNVPGRIQVADICTNIFYRYFRKDPDIRAYDVLKSRVVGRDGYLIRMITVAERSLHKDDLSNHVSRSSSRNAEFCDFLMSEAREVLCLQSRVLKSRCSVDQPY
jgi:hypothetical protein